MRFSALCVHCGYRFVVTQDSQSMEKLWLKIQNSIEGQGCPECGDTQLELEILCGVKSEDCFFLVR